MSMEGLLRELQHEAGQPGSPVHYHLIIDEQRILLNDRIGSPVTLTFLQHKACKICGRKVNKLYNNGYCYPCVTTLAECDLCIVKPHECHFHLGTCRDEEFAKSHCMIPHFVYLAVSSGIKVGLTRKSREMTRWVDQGAIRAVPIAEAPTRKVAGEMEYWIAQHIPDKTNWRKMLSGVVDEINIEEIQQHIREILPEEYRPYLLEEEHIRQFTYPVTRTPEKIKSVTFDKEEIITGVLTGIKGQYMIFEDKVLNVKKHTGYRVRVSFEG